MECAFKFKRNNLPITRLLRPGYVQLLKVKNFILNSYIINECGPCTKLLWISLYSGSVDEIYYINVPIWKAYVL